MASRRSGSTGNSRERLGDAPVAIIGMSSIFPMAQDLPEYWDNIFRKIDCIVDVPSSRWSIDEYYDPDPAAADKTYCKRGGFIPDIDFDPMEFGLPPNILEVTDVSQLLALVVAREAMEDAGYGEEREFPRENAGVILGVVGMSAKLFTPLMSRLQYPLWEKVLKSAGISDADTRRIIEKIQLGYVGWEENAFPGAIGNVIAGRIANRLNLGATNCVIDAACASSLAAVRMAISELSAHRADLMITGGVDTDNSISTFMCFSKTPAFTRADKVQTFDAESSGMMVGEGLGMLVLKRLADAERDGDRIYALIRGMGSSSDGRFKSIYAPRPSGQALALRRAYEDAGFAPATIGLMEAHGTGTAAGDPAEFQGLREVFAENNPARQHIALGSVKSQIGHTKSTAGAAGLIKVALALHHKVLPPTINVTRPNPRLDVENSPFYINTETRLWMPTTPGAPRRAGVSAFGFGGTNFHVVLEEYQGEQQGAYRLNRVAQPVLLSAETPEELLAACQDAAAKLAGEGGPEHFSRLVDASRSSEPEASEARLAFVAEDAGEALEMLRAAVKMLKEKPQEKAWESPNGVHYRRSALEAKHGVVALFSGQGSQYLEMGRELAANFPPVREVFQAVDRLFSEDGLPALSGRVYPPPVFNAEARKLLSEALTRTEHAQPAIGALSAGLFKLLQQAGFRPSFTAGHSFGEWTALWAAGVLSDEDYYRLAQARGKAMAAPEDPAFDAGTMLAVRGEASKVAEDIRDFPQVSLANYNARNQVVLAGPKAAVGAAQKALAEKGYAVTPLPVSAAFHTALVGHAQQPFAEEIAATRFQAPVVRVFSNQSGKEHAPQPEKIQASMREHILSPVRWMEEIENIYAAGGRIFVEFGPKSVLTNLVKNILEGREHVAVALNANPKKDSDRQLREAVVQLRVAGLPLAGFDPYELRSPRPAKKKSPVTVTLNGGHYVSEKTRNAFQEALADGFRVQAAAPATKAPALEPPQRQASSPAAAGAAKMDADVLLQGLAQFRAQQSETAQIHTQYLQNEQAYAQAFAQLTQSGLSLLSEDNLAGEQLEQLVRVVQGLERSLGQLHEHQAETLRVHEQYLKSQEVFAQNFARLLEQQAANGNGYHAGVAPSRPDLGPRFAEAEAQPAAWEASEQRTGNGGKPAVPAATPPEATITAPAAQPAIAPPGPVLTPGGNLQADFLEIVAEKTGYPAEMLEPDMDMEADLGIDSIKRVEILGTVREQYPELPKIEPERFAELRTLRQVIDHVGSTLPEVAAPPAAAPLPPEDAPPSAGPAALAVDLSNAFLQVVAEKTGYPVEMLEPDMDMEADLGIDSIKRVEIIGAMREMYPDLPKVEPEAFAELRTLRQVTAHLQQSLQTAFPAALAETDDGSQTQEAGIQRSLVTLKTLPEPDALELSIAGGHVTLVTDDGTETTSQLVAALSQRGLRPVVLSFPEEMVPTRPALPEGVERVALPDMSEAHLQQRLAEISAAHGPAAIVIHLNPGFSSENGAYFSEGEKAVVKHVFLLAKHQKEALNQAAKHGRSAFITVARLDGAFGLGNRHDFEPVSGGLFGLVKSLNLEWEAVFCRGIDLSPALDPAQSAARIIAELYDPNRRLTEVGYTLEQRLTLAVEQADRVEA